MRRFSMSYLTAPVVSPLESIRIASDVGYDHLGLRIHPTAAADAPSPLLGNKALAAECRRRLDNSGLTVTEVESWMIRRGFDLSHSAGAMEAAAELGSPRLIAVADMRGAIEQAEIEDRFAGLAEMASGFGLGVDFEPIAHRAAGTLDEALAVIAAGAPHGAGLILDMLHIDRMGISPAELAMLDRSLLHNVHLCDAPPKPADLETMVRHSAFDRDLPGEGALPLRAYLAALPTDRPLSIEIPMLRLANTVLPQERARRGLATSKRLLAEIEAAG
ncbi:sugar phosphate isomerase/epimerase [Aminobacter sp. NyZ550]|uniref:sugar phosphate isomerase/epimerase family protein n=1 Tax=unclassified Aminobacter TaxID=2644704 RepID=UPI0012AF358D|nr:MULTISPECIES: sugar phosphate isomerase/epimerase [unclassified Aminobacter]MRX37094.1 TIM barrel protein [Aminobacter sp. MDW-2]QNH35848.1 sugar phosphate isomerase/epimerase [Aminobacter sp. MDW-2]WAX96538.1 sugar phosphate isomerase/epimerase [Aminobacter sp. NyZ550]